MNSFVRDVILILTALGILLTVILAQVPSLPQWVAVSLSCINALVAFLNRFNSGRVK